MRQENNLRQTRAVFILSAWFGILAGLGEGVGLVVLQHYEKLNWNIALQKVSERIIWVSPLFNLFLFSAVGLLVVLAGKQFVRLPVVRAALFLVLYLTLFDWLGLSGQVRLYSVAVLALGMTVAFLRWFRKHEDAALRLWSRTLPWVAAVALLALLGIEGTSWLAERRAIRSLPAARMGSPNILVILLDTMRSDHLSAYGYSRATSPNLDRLALQGILFENAIAPSSWTLPSHASLLTGRYPTEHGAELKMYRQKFRTIVDELRSRGYRTAAFSANTFNFARFLGFGPGFIRFEDVMATAEDMAAGTYYGRKFYRYILLPLGFEDLPGRRCAASMVPSVLDWMKSDRDHPSFTFVNFFDLHEPYLPPRPWRTRFSKLPNPGGKIYSVLKRYEPKPEDLQGEIDAYDGAISYLDEQIGVLLAGLEREGLARDTLVVATSDHGEMFGEHGLYHHRNALYRPLVQVPLILVWPDKLPRNLRIARPVSNAALAATFLDLLGVRDQTLFPIRSLVPLWTSADGAAEWPLPLSELAQGFFEPLVNSPARYGSMKSLVAPGWHFICHERDGAAMFDWKSDSAEAHDLAPSPEGQRITAEAVRIMKQDLAHPAFPNCAPGAQTAPNTTARKP